MLGNTVGGTPGPPSLHLFGLPRLLDAEQRPLGVGGRKSIGLLAYLALTGPQVHSRERLSGLFWPDLADKDARNNLRVSLSRIARCLDAVGEPVIRAGRSAGVRFNPAAPIRCDALEFQAIADEVAGHDHDDPLCCDSCHRQRARADALYSAEFMQGFRLDECVEFDDWLYVLRERMKRTARENLNALARQADVKGELAASERCTRRVLELDEFDEAAHRRLLTLLVSNGERQRAIAHIARFRQRLRTELDAEPGAETRSLMLRVEDGSLERARSRSSVDRVPAIERRPIDDPVPNNLPVERFPYIGNRASLERLGTRIERCRCVTLTGIGGIGKTRLAVQAGRDLLPRFTGGVWFVRLSSSSTRTEMLSNLATVLDVRLHPGDDPVVSIVNQLDSSRRLLILDNFEHLLPECDIVVTLLERVPGMTLLITSRQRLMVSEESVFPLAGLHHHGSDSRTESDGPGNDAADLFVEVARRTVLGFDLDGSHADEIGHIARLVEGHPLSLVIAAGWIDGLSCQGIREELERGLGILETDSSDVPERQRSVRATFNTSWDRLDEREREVFSALAVFGGGFARQAARQIVGASVQQLARLVRKSLLQHDPERDRYELHELLRQYARERLDASSVVDEVTTLHGRHYMGLLRDISAGQTHDQARRHRQRFSEDFFNIRQAWFLMLETEQVQELTLAARGLRIMCSLGAHSHDLLDLLQPALPLISDDRRDPAHRELVLHLLLAIGFAYRYTKGYFAQELGDIFSRAYALTDGLDTSPELFVVLYGRWSFNFTNGRMRENAEIISQWRARIARRNATFQALPYVRDAAFIIDMLEGPQRQNQGELSAARALMLDGLRREDPSRSASILGNYGLDFSVSGRHWLAINQCIAGDLDDSERTMSMANDVAENENNPYLSMFVAFGQIILATLRRDVVQILVHAARVSSLVSEHRIFHAFQYHSDICSAYALGLQDAQSDVEPLRAIVDRDAGIPIFRLFDVQLLAEALVRAGSPEQAISRIETATASARRSGVLIHLSSSHRIVGDAHAAMGEPSRARASHQQALDVAEDQGAGLYQFRAVRALARSHVAMGDPSAAQALLSQAVGRFNGCRELPEYQAAVDSLRERDDP